MAVNTKYARHVRQDLPNARQSSLLLNSIKCPAELKNFWQSLNIWGTVG